MLSFFGLALACALAAASVLPIAGFLHRQARALPVERRPLRLPRA